MDPAKSIENKSKKNDTTKLRMKAVIHNRYGKAEYLSIEDVPLPIPQKKEIRIKINTSTITPSDVVLRLGKFPFVLWLPTRLMFGLLRPRRKILGYELSGTVDETGSEVTSFKVGDEVIASTYWKMSCHAEYICLPEEASIVKKPKGITKEEAAAIPDGSSTALYFLRMAELQSGQHILIYGASGSVGSYAIQIAKSMKAQVTAVCSSKNFDMVKSLGADYVIDYTTTDYSTLETKYEVVFDAVGRSTFHKARHALTEGGIYLTTNFLSINVLFGKFLSLFSSKRFKTGVSTGGKEKLSEITHLIENGKIIPFIDRSYTLEEIQLAHEYVQTGRKRGNVLILIDK